MKQYLISFLKSQYGSLYDPQTGKISIYVLFAKIKILITLPITIVIVGFIRLIKPLILVRFGRIGTGRIGHFSIDPELYLCRRDAEMCGKKIYDIFYFTGYFGNQQLKKMWKRTLSSSFFANPVDKINRLFPGWNKHVITLQEGYMALKSYGDPEGLLESMPRHLYFTPEEEDWGLKETKKIGVPSESAFICFQARDSAFLYTVLKRNDWRYHDYRDSNIHNYISAAYEMTRRGFYAIRMGHTVRESLSVKQPEIIDYATKHRNDFMDIYLLAKCHFAILAHCGLKHVAIIFRTPVVCVNVIRHMGLLYLTSRDICIPKNLWLRNEKRFMTFKEVFESGVANFGATNQYENYGIEIKENTTEEITAAAIEMDERLKGTWKTTEEDEELQQRFRNIIFKSKLPDGTPMKDILPLGLKCKIGAEFLRQNKELLN
jgi:putative glycosyltransferase (TIGR04372 family)